MIVLRKRRLKSYITQSDKSVMTDLLRCRDSVNRNHFDSILAIENFLLLKGKSLYPLKIILEVSKFYDISVFDLIGKTRRDEKARKARKIMIYMLDFKAAGLITHSDIARIMNRKPSSSTIGYAIKSVTDTLSGNCGDLRDDIVTINEKLVEH